MVVTPSRGYRVCCECGTIMKAGQLKANYGMCTGCGVGFAIKTHNHLMTPTQAKNYLKCIEFNAKHSTGFGLSDVDANTLKAMYDMYGIPLQLRVYG